MAKQETQMTTKTQAPPPVLYQAGPSVVDSSDLIVPKLLLAQGLSKAVAEGEAKMGDIRNSLSGVVIGGPNKPVPFIPITIKKYWKKFEVVNDKKQYRGTEPFTQANASREREDVVIEGKTYAYDLVIDAFGFTEEDVQDPIALPTAISFTRTSYKAGQKMNTHFASLDGAQPRIPYFTYMMQITCTKTSNDKGIFYQFDVKPMLDGTKPKKTPTEYFPKIDRWSKLLNDSTRNVVVDNADEETASNGATASNVIDEDKY